MQLKPVRIIVLGIMFKSFAFLFRKKEYVKEEK